MSKYDVILFDLDGTVLDTLADLHCSVNAVLADFGFPLRSKTEVRRFLGNGIRRLMISSVPEGTSPETMEKVIGSFREYYTVHCRDETKPYPGVPLLLQQLKSSGISLGMVSNKNDEAVQLLVGEFFPGIFDIIVGQTLARSPKPEPDMVEFALKKLGLTNARCLYVGDSEVDRMTAENAGMDCALVTWGFRDLEFLAELNAKVLISQPEDLLRFLNL